MLTKEVDAALNAQIGEEYYSSYLYASMANYFESISLRGFASWMRTHSDEELAHARKLTDYVNDRGGRVILQAIAAPRVEWESPIAAMQAAYEHECHISQCINKLSSLCMKHDDHATHAFLKWFIDEQVEEESVVNDVVQQLKLVEGAPSGLFLVDRDLGGRAPAPGGAV